MGAIDLSTSAMVLNASRMFGHLQKKGHQQGEVYQTQGILAPGTEILGAQVGGGTVLGTGTSYATAVVSGVAALLLSLQLKYGQEPNPQLIRKILLESAVKEENGSPRLLAGRLNIAGILPPYYPIPLQLCTVSSKHFCDL